MDRLARVDALELRVAYLARGFAETPWCRPELRHGHWFPRAIGSRTRPMRAVHPGVVTTLLAPGRPHACVVSGWSDPTALLVMAACSALGIPYVLGGETFEETGRSGAWPWLRRSLVRRAVRGAGAWLPTGTLASSHLVRLGADPARCHPFPTTSDARALSRRVDELRGDAPAMRARLSLPDDGVILFVGRLVEDKAPLVLMDALEQLRRAGRRLVLLVAGEGPERSRMERHPAAGAARLLGFVQPEVVAELLAVSDLLVLPSRHETWGAVVGEALAAGLPVVVSDRVGSAPDYVHGGDVGAVAPVDDARALADAIAATLDRPDRRTTLPGFARARAAAQGHDLCLASLVTALREVGLRLAAPGGAGDVT